MLPLPGVWARESSAPLRGGGAGSQARGEEPGQRARRLLSPETKLPGVAPSDSCSDPGGRGQSARPLPAREAPPALPAELDLASKALGLDGRTRETPTSSLFSVSKADGTAESAGGALLLPALPMHLPGCAPAMADGSFSIAGHLLRSPGGSTSRLHSIEAILGFTKDDGILGSFPTEPGARGAKERDRRPGARAICPKAPGGGAEPSPPPAPAPAPGYEGEYSTTQPRGSRGPQLRNSARRERPCLNFYQGSRARVWAPEV